MSAIDLDYVPGSCVGELRLERVKKHAEHFAHNYEFDRVELPGSYVAHLSEFHGGIPRRRCFRTPSGKVRFIGRFLNFLEKQDVDKLLPSWRPGSIDWRLDYGITSHGHDSDVNWNRMRALIPFAAIDTAGHDPKEMSEMDLLCFDYSELSRPVVVTWSFHESFEDNIVKERIANSFEEFAESLTYCPKSLETMDKEKG